MWMAVKEVFKELITFWFRRRSVSSVPLRLSAPPTRLADTLLAAPPQLEMLPASLPLSGNDRSTHDHDTETAPDRYTYLDTILYTTKQQNPVYAVPRVGFDTVTRMMPYATTVRAGEVVDGFVAVSEVASPAERVGWMKLTDVTEHERDVLPHFYVGTRYTADHPDTQKVRQSIRDAFHAGLEGWPLSAPEYVTYRLLRNRQSIEWPVAHGRVAGVWHQLLRGLRSVRIAVEPATRAVMEGTAVEAPFLGYVEAVFPDDSLTVSSITASGRYEERTLTPAEWREWRPVFLSVL